MNIAIDSRPYFEKQKDGISGYFTNLLDNIVKIDHSNDYTLFVNEDCANNFDSRKIDLKILKNPKMCWPQTRLTYHFLTNKDKFDLFFAPAHSIPFYTGCKKVAVIHDLAYKKFREYFTNFDYIMLSKLTTNFAIKYSDHLIADSISTKNDIIEFYDVKPEKISVIYLGYDKNKFYRRSSEEIEKTKIRYKINNDYIIFVGTLQKRKNVERLIRAYDLLVKKGRKEKLVIVGKKGWLYDDIFNAVSELRLKDNVIFTDYVPENDLSALISGAKCFVLPSLYEGFGLPLLEAMACGTPVVTSNVSSLPEICSDAGILINNPYSIEEIAERILGLIDDDLLRSNLSSKGLERARLFSWEKCAKQTLEVLTRVNEQ
ncbi:MAG: glycosyltransferase family 1 protein [Patescibacteria group bacterium]|jgi:glycosyltransferase involved in cell wall biosynthesis